MTPDLEARVRALAEEWRYKGEFGWGPWQAGEGPDPEGQVLDQCASRLLALLDAEPQPDAASEDDAEALTELIVAHQRIPMYGHIPNAQRCTGCDHLKAESDGPNSPRHAAHLAQVILASDRFAANRARQRAEAHEDGYQQGLREGRDEAETRDLSFDGLTDRAEAAERRLAEQQAAVLAKAAEWERTAGRLNASLTAGVRDNCARDLRAALNDTTALNAALVRARREALREAADEIVGRDGSNPVARYLRDRADALGTSEAS
jgi:hypothetical protein